MLFFVFINVKMPTIIGILTFMSRQNFMLSWVKHEKSFTTSGPDYMEPTHSCHCLLPNLQRVFCISTIDIKCGVKLLPVLYRILVHIFWFLRIRWRRSSSAEAEPREYYFPMTSSQSQAFAITSHFTICTCALIYLISSTVDCLCTILKVGDARTLITS